MDEPEIAGWYGKLPSLGDFATRRLPPEFVEAWDGWLAAGLASWRENAPESWLENYLSSPSWRFLLMPGLVAGDRRAWAGVLMPSVDRVGRYFPLTLAQPLAAMPGDGAQAEGLLRWLHRLDDLAVDALQDDWSIERLEHELHRLGTWQPGPRTVDGAGISPAQWQRAMLLDLPARAGIGALLAGVARDALLHMIEDKALWLCDDGSSMPTLRITNGLPGSVAFPTLLMRPATPAPESNDPRGP